MGEEKERGAPPCLLELLQLRLLPPDEILRPPRRRKDAVGHRLVQFRFGSTCLLRDREVLRESVGAADRHGTGDADQLAGFEIENLFVLKIEYFFRRLHLDLLCQKSPEFRAMLSF